MKKRDIAHRLLIGVSLSAIVFLFFHRAHLSMTPTPIVFTNTDIAYGYSISTFSGTVYHDQGITHVGAGTGIALHVNGVASKTGTTNVSGVYSFSSVTINRNDVITVYLDGEDEDGVLVAKFNDAELSDGSVTGMDIYKDRLILRTLTTNLNVTTTNLRTADNVGDADVTAVYTVDGNDLRLGYNKELLIWGNTTHTASGSIFTHDLEVKGTLTMGTGNITASGSVVAHGVITLTGNMNLTSVESGELLLLKSTSTQNLILDNGLEAYFRLDEGIGVNASGSTLNTATGGTLTNSPIFVQTNTGTTLFYNPYAVEFDGENDAIIFNDSYDLSLTKKKTFATWFRRKSFTTDDVIFAKKTASGSLNAGYVLYIDDTTDKIIFELANGSNSYTVTSNSAITNENWQHVAVTFDPLHNNGTNIFLNGSIDVANKSGSLNPSSNSVANAISFTIGNDAGNNGPFEGSIDDFRIYSRAMTGNELSVLATGTKTTGFGTYYLGSVLDVNGDLGIYSQTLDTGTGYTIQVEENLTAYGLLRSPAGTVTLNGTSQTIRGSTAFKNIAKAVTSSTTLTFESNTEQTVSGSLSLQGAVNNSLRLRASATGIATHLIVDDAGTTVLQFLNVKDNDASSGVLLSCTEGCLDGGNTTNWEFLSSCQDGIVAGSEQCDDGNSVNTDSCPNDCQLSVCGDGVVEGIEECDPPNTGSCLSNCQLRGAGGGGGARGSAASATSFYKRPDPPEGCGNGLLDRDKGEECDTGQRNNGLGTCSYDCKLLTCGDGTISPQIGEDCEPKSLGEVDGVQTFEVQTCGLTCTIPEVSKQGTKIGGCKRVFLPECGSSTDEPLRPSAPSQCGNGIVESKEECDFGGSCTGGEFDGSFWSDKASAQKCIEAGGTTRGVSGDGCSDTCKTEFCGDGEVQTRGADNQPGTSDDEDCDNGSTCMNDPTASCRLDADCPVGTTCDYADAKDVTCSNTCKSTATKQSIPPLPNNTPVASTVECGNGKVEQGEECDEGSKNGKADSTCSKECTVIAKASAPEQKREPRCGDGTVDTGEQCDAGDKNSDVVPNACRTNCRRSYCGDFVQDKGEQCDNGNGNSNLYGDTCRMNCVLPYCGDGIQDSDEECDRSLTCQPNCRRAVPTSLCGNRQIDGVEQCDDGNRSNGDGCDAYCRMEQLKNSAPACGNGIVEAGEQCDPPSAVSKNGIMCSPACQNIAVVETAVEDFDADVVVVNPTEFANALTFLGSSNPCATLVVKGQDIRADTIRDIANRKGIPIVENIALARALYASVSLGEIIFGQYCDEINIVKANLNKTSEPAPSNQPEQPMEILFAQQDGKKTIIPQIPVVPGYGYYPYAQVSPIITSQAPIGDTGPGLIGIGITGVAAGMGWMRRRKKRG